MQALDQNESHINSRRAAATLTDKVGKESARKTACKTASLFDLSGKVALVAGGGGYLGWSACEGLSACGAHVIVADRRIDAAHDVAGHAKLHGSAEACELDVGDESSIQQALASIDRLDILVNMTTFSHGKMLQHATAEEWMDGLRVTLVGAFLLTRAAADRMGPTGGSMIHFSSMYGMVSPQPGAYVSNTPNPPDYGAAKAGILQLTRYQAVFWAKRGIRVNAVVPGPFPNPTVQQRHPRVIEQLTQRVPLGRIGHAREIAGAVVYLASDAASYVTGTSLVVDGGWTAW